MYSIVLRFPKKKKIRVTFFFFLNQCNDAVYLSLLFKGTLSRQFCFILIITDQTFDEKPVL